MPLVTSKQISDYLKEQLCNSKPKVQVIDTFPNNLDQVSYGLYINGVNVVSRTVQQESMTFCGRVYEITDEFEVLFVSFQNDKRAPQIEAVIQNLVDETMFDGYSSITYEVAEDIGSKSNIKNYTFTLERIDTSQL